MNEELDFLHLLLVVGMVIAPIVTGRFFIGESRIYDVSHVLAITLTTAGLRLALPTLTFAWLFFCGFGFSLFLRRNSARVFSVYGATASVPFVFSIIAATWLVSGANGFELLGYGEAFSYYASLHGHFLGWIMVGGVAFMANEAGRFRRFYIAAVLGCFGSFLLVAFGIDGIPLIKPLGVFGLTVLIATSQIMFLVTIRKTSQLALTFGLVSFFGFVFTMVLAWQNELGITTITSVFGIRAMVSLHGIVNGFIVAPCFFLAIYFGLLRKG